MTTHSDSHSGNAPLSPELQALLEIRDTRDFEASLDKLFLQRQKDIFRALGHLTRDLHDSFVRLGNEADSLPMGAPHARQSLHEALALSANAAHENLALVERLRPQATELVTQAQEAKNTASTDTDRHLAENAEQFANTCLENFTQLVVSQSWQDLTGQRLQRVSLFIDKVERTLLDLARLTGSVGGAGIGDATPAEPLSTQDEVDRLLSEFGF